VAGKKQGRTCRSWNWVFLRYSTKEAYGILIEAKDKMKIQWQLLRFFHSTSLLLWFRGDTCDTCDKTLNMRWKVLCFCVVDLSLLVFRSSSRAETEVAFQLSLGPRM
jgi:hypothetical protein